MKILVVTTEWPRFTGDLAGIHVIHQLKRLEALGIQADVFSFQGRKNPFNYWLARHDFLQRDFSQYDLVHAHHGQSGLVALAQRRLPVVATFHGSDLQGIRDMRGRVTFSGYILRYVSRWVASRANAVILVSESLAGQLPRSVQYRVIPAGIDTHLFRPIPRVDARQALGLPAEGRLVLFVGDPARTEKRHWLAQATIQCLPSGFSAQLVVAYNVRHERMPLYMNACDVLLVTSSTEGSPNAVKEALACNLPVVSTDVGDIRSRIAPIAGCQVCADDAPETLAQTLFDVLSNPEPISGRESVLDLDESHLAGQVLALYKQVLGMPV